MGFYFRKSAKVGPFRLNFSKSGIGVSAGVKGARVSMGPSGTFVHLGAGGIYYKKRLGTNTKPSGRPGYGNTPREETSPQIGEHTITTLNFDGLSDSNSQEFIKELESKEGKVSYFKWLGWVPALVILWAMFS
ncbi:DUF4236 domain-containing protein [Rufibacter sp. LB8]|uniref:DUF4236 domain-containing protein n=1 Tax=Rufibacter sp. LB8 TaxID=2777781 RepID=UPI00178C26A4|nr:DUF4236 domain-containing protein [Rufibacter sp. LB8]